MRGGPRGGAGALALRRLTDGAAGRYHARKWCEVAQSGETEATTALIPRQRLDPGTAPVVGIPSMFTGEYRHSVDDKGRLAVPSRFRAQLDAGLVVSRWLDACLAIHTRAGWDALAEKVATLPIPTRTPVASANSSSPGRSSRPSTARAGSCCRAISVRWPVSPPTPSSSALAITPRSGLPPRGRPTAGASRIRRPWPPRSAGSGSQGEPVRRSGTGGRTGVLPRHRADPPPTWEETRVGG